MRNALVFALALSCAAPAHLRAQGTPVRVAESPARLQLEQELVLGGMDGPAAFGRIMDVKLGRRGKVYVADDRRPGVLVFDRGGRLVGSVGREGRGPGEFQAPWRIALDANDSLFVWDVGLRRVSVFGPDLAHARDFRVPPHWVVNSMAFLPDGSLLVAAYGPGEAGVLHVLDRRGALRSTFGPRPPPGDFAGFEASLLGGYAAVDGARIVYSNKSPYEVSVLDRASGRLLSRCTGNPAWTTPPSSVVRQTPQAAALEMNRYVHSAGVFPLGDGRYLNVLFDPVQNRATVDLLTDRCVLERRTTLPGNLVFSDLAAGRLAASRELDYPEVVIYRVRVVGAPGQPSPTGHASRRPPPPS